MPTNGTDHNGPLKGVSVLDFGRILSAPHVARLLADMGADVIHVESKFPGDESRDEEYQYAPGLSGMFFQTAWGKKSLSIDLKHPSALEFMHRLIPKIDIVIENFRPGVMKRLGLAYEDLAKLQPSIIMCSISAYGQTGPYALRPGFGSLAEAIAGLPDLTGEPDGPPMPTLIALADNMAAGLGLASICAALYDKAMTRRGRYIDMALLDAAFQMHDIGVQAYIGSGGAVMKTRRGLRDTNWVPWGYFKGQDAWVCIMVGVESMWPKLAEAIGRADLAADPRYDSYEKRFKERDFIYGLLEEWVKGFSSVDQIVELLNDAGVPCARVNDIAGAVKDPQIRSRQMLVERDHPVVGRVEVMSPFGPNFADSAARGHPPFLGEHNRWVATELGGYSDREFDELAAARLFDHDERYVDSAGELTGTPTA